MKARAGWRPVVQRLPGRLLMIFIWLSRRKGWLEARNCLALFLGLGICAWVLLLVLRLLRHRGRDRFAPPDGDVDRSKRPMPVEQRVPAKIYRRPDPLIYSQTYLASQGVAVTWDNPDIHLERDGIPVSSHDLVPSTSYEIVARVWNGSMQAPAVDIPVRFSYLEFGIGTVRNELGLGKVSDLPVKGAPGLPAFARFPWTTPGSAGHYCLQVELLWADDANPHNNLGQENTDVKPLNSPRAHFVVPVRNDAPVRRVLRLEIDSYRIGEPTPCPQVPNDGRQIPNNELRVRRRQALNRHSREAHPLPAGWTVDLDVQTLALAPGEQTDVHVKVVAPDGFIGRQSFNLNAFAGETLTGGVTLIVEGKA